MLGIKSFRVKRIRKGGRGRSSIVTNKLVVSNLHSVPLLMASDVSIDRDVLEVNTTFVTMLLRLSFRVRDSKGRMVDDHKGWSLACYKADRFIGGDNGDDIATLAWYRVNDLIDSVLDHIPYSSLKEIHYSIVSGDIAFYGGTVSSRDPFVDFVNHDMVSRWDGLSFENIPLPYRT